MLFNSITFAVFLPVVFIIYWMLPHKYRWALLLAASYCFYMGWNAKYIVLIFFITILSYIAAILIEREEHQHKKKVILGITILLCLSILVFFKYFNFLNNSIASLCGIFSIQFHPVILDIVVPVGISFYTFQALGYVIDVYRGGVRAENHFGIYATFISFFPQLVAGPIERTENLMLQIKKEHFFEYEKATYGLKLMAWGFFKKMAVADALAHYVDVVFAAPQNYRSIDLVVASLFFTVQIYCDFSGYSDIAVGTAKLMGIELMTNFKSPYFSASIKEFWSRWHISLSTWFRDYIYIPLGGNRVSKGKHFRNLLITFLISGLWHGADWTFIVWGGCYGALQIMEDIWGERLKKLRQNKFGRMTAIIGEFFLCNLLWIFFRAASVSEAFYFVEHMFCEAGNWEFGKERLNLSEIDLIIVYFNIFVLAVFDFFSLKRDVIVCISKWNAVVRWCIYLLFIWLIMISLPMADAEFIYFQF